MTIKAIIFDYGEVLNAGTHGEEEATNRAEAAARLDVPADELWTYLFDSPASKAWMTGKLTWDEFWAKVLAPHGITDPDEISHFSRKVLPVTTQLNPEMVRLLDELKGRYALAVLSNSSWPEEEMKKRLYNDFELPGDTFDVVVTSSSIGAVKPQAEIFQETLYQLGVEAEEAIFIDDMPQFTAAAASLGIHSHTFTAPADLRGYLKSMGIIIK